MKGRLVATILLGGLLTAGCQLTSPRNTVPESDLKPAAAPGESRLDTDGVKARLQAQGLKVEVERGDYFLPLFGANKYDLISVERHPLAVYEYSDAWAAAQGLHLAQGYLWRSKPQMVTERNLLIIFPEADAAFAAKVKAALR